MKKYLVFIILLASNCFQSFGCPYEPYGESTRFSLFLPDYFRNEYYHYSQYCYSHTNRITFSNLNSNSLEPNVNEWYLFTNKKVPTQDITDFMYYSNFTDIDPQNQNKFIQYLYSNKLKTVIEYFKYAKRCEEISGYDTLSSNTWERNENSANLNSELLIQDLKKITPKTSSKWLQRKYAFLLIKTLFYSQSKESSFPYFEKYFKNDKQKDYLYYWALSFSLESNSKHFYNDLANLVANSPEKSGLINYGRKFELNDALKNAQDNEEKANAYGLVSLKKITKNLDILKLMYEFDSYSDLLDFLILREVNKIEDWVYTPYYTNYTPLNFKGDSFSAQTLRERSERDRIYAMQFYIFLKNIDINSVKNKKLWKAAKIQMAFIAREYSETLELCTNFYKDYPNDELANQIIEIETLSQVCLLPKNNPFPENIIKTILKNKSNYKFIFAVGRELEFKGDLSIALAIYAHINSQNNWYPESSDNYLGFKSKSTVYWNENRSKKSANLVSFYDYFDYIDYVYSSNDLENIINNWESKKKYTAVEKRLFTPILTKINDFKELLGTKYFRENKLEKSLTTFEKIPSYHNNSAILWERDELSKTEIIQNNPFFEFNHTTDFIPHKKNFFYTKLILIKTIIKYKKLAEDINNKNRDYYYFILGNVYYNLSQNGNNPYIRRFNYTPYYELNESYVDEREFRKCDLSQEYYDKASHLAKSRKFKALCLRMKEYAQKGIENYSIEYKLLKKTYPEYYEDLSGCDHLTEYFNTRN